MLFETRHAPAKNAALAGQTRPKRHPCDGLRSGSVSLPHSSANASASIRGQRYVFPHNIGTTKFTFSRKTLIFYGHFTGNTPVFRAIACIFHAIFRKTLHFPIVIKITHIFAKPPNPAKFCSKFNFPTGCACASARTADGTKCVLICQKATMHCYFGNNLLPQSTNYLYLYVLF